MKKHRYQLVIFDLDGTLIDSKNDIMSSVNATLKNLNLPERSASELLQHVGSGIEPLLAQAVSGNGAPSLEKTLEVFKEHYLSNLLSTTKPYPGVISGLNSLSDIKVCVLTNKSFLFSDKIIKGLQMDHFFEFLYGGDSFPKKKPNPMAITQILTDTGISKAESLMVGDSPVDIEAGRRAGIDTCGVSYGYKDEKDLIESGANYLKNSFSEVIQVVGNGA